MKWKSLLCLVGILGTTQLSAQTYRFYFGGDKKVPSDFIAVTSDSRYTTRLVSVTTCFRRPKLGKTILFSFR